MKYKVKTKRYIDDESLTWEERYKRLEKHHLEETKELIKTIEEIERLNDRLIALAQGNIGS